MGLSSWKIARPTLRSQPNEVRRRRVRPAAELVEITAGAERSAFPPQLNLRDIGRCGRQRERFDEPIPHRRIEGVEPIGPGQRDRQDITVARHPDPGPAVLLDASGMSATPGGELRPGLENGVRGRLGHEALAHRQAVLPAQQQGEGRRGNGMVGDVLRNPLQRRIALIDRHVAQIEPTVVDRTVRQAHHHERQAHSGFHHRFARVRQPLVQVDQDCASSLGRDLATQFSE